MTVEGRAGDNGSPGVSQGEKSAHEASVRDVAPCALGASSTDDADVPPTIGDDEVPEGPAGAAPLVLMRQEPSEGATPEDPSVALCAALKDGSLSVQDFAYPAEDERHRGIGSTVPHPDEGKTAPDEAVVAYGFLAESDNEMTVEAGQHVRVLHAVEGGWVVAQTLDGAHRGLVPEAYLRQS